MTSKCYTWTRDLCEDSLMNMNPVLPDTILRAVHMVKSAIEKSDQGCSVFKNGQQLFKTTQMI